MKNFKKSQKLENVKYAIRGRLMEEANKLEQNGNSILKLNIGNPAVFNFSAPNSILESMKNNLEHSQGYSDSKGVKIAREAIKKYYKGKNVNELALDDIFIGNGVSELILMSMQALLNPNDEILVPMPDYPLWTASVNLAGGKAVHYICDENNEWYPNISDIKSKITKNTKGIIIINPNNPTGALYPEKILKQIVDIAKENELIIFADEIYDRLVFDELEHISIASLSKDVPVVTFSGLSKSHMVAGFRIGWMCITGNRESIKDYINGLNLLSSMRLCANVPGQNIIADAITDNNSIKALLKKGGRLYEQRECIYNELNNIPGISVVKPKAAFYIFPKIDDNKFNIINDEIFALDFLRSKHILFINGTGFNWKEQNHFRLVYLAECDKLKYATDNLKSFLNGYIQKV